MSIPCKVSVIIPTFNRAKLLIEAIESVLAQKYRNYEIIVVDDGSTDETREVLIPYLAEQRIRYIFQKNKKQASARNTGIRNSKGEYIAFLDSDDLWLSDKLELQVHALEENPEAGMVYCNQYLIELEADKEERIKYQKGMLKSGWIFKDLLLRKFYCSTPTLLIRRAVLDKVGLFDESLEDALEDWEFTLRISRDYQVIAIDEPLIKRRIQPPSAEVYHEKRITNHRRILERYLKNSQLPKYFKNLVWSKSIFSWGKIYLEKGQIRKALACFLKAAGKGHLGAALFILLCFLRPVYFMFAQKKKIIR